MTRYLTPDEFIIRAVNEYPSLYAGPTYDEVKFRILDHTLNTIGNGIYMESFMGEPVTEEEIQAAQKWFKCKKASYGYINTRQLGKGRNAFKMPDGDPVCVVPIREKKNHPEVKYWVDFDCTKERDPYPNFQKQYSSVWDNRDIQFAKLGKEWAQAAGWFYNRCRDYFMDSEKVKGYHGAFPQKEEHETEHLIESYKKFIGDTTKYPTNEDISKAYETEFTGDRTNDEDVARFIAKRWEHTQQAHLDFIKETIGYLNTLIVAETA